MNTLFVGVDVSKKANAVCILQPDGTTQNRFRIPNNPEGAKKLTNLIVSNLESLKISNVAIGIEATSVYADPLVYTLQQDENLGRYAPHIQVLNPTKVKKFKESYSELPKNDYVDAFVIADHLRFGRSKLAVVSDDYRYKELQMLTRARFFAIKYLAQEKQRFANYLFLKFSGIAMDDKLDNTSATILALVKKYHTVDSLAAASLDELTDYVDKSSQGHYSNPKKVAERIQAAVSASYRLPESMNDSVNKAMALTIASISTIEAKVKRLDKAIANQLKKITNPLTTIPGIGPVYSAGIMAEIGDIRRFAGDAQLAKFAGLAWLQHQSGEKERERKTKIKSGNRFLLYYLKEGVNSVRQYDSEYKQYYERKYKEVKYYQHKRALSLTARKFVRLVYKLLKEKRFYDPPEQK